MAMLRCLTSIVLDTDLLRFHIASKLEALSNPSLRSLAAAAAARVGSGVGDMLAGCAAAAAESSLAVRQPFSTLKKRGRPPKVQQAEEPSSSSEAEQGGADDSGSLQEPPPGKDLQKPAAAPPVHRPPGRPPKVMRPGESAADDPSSTSAPPVPVKRGPGRPPKNRKSEASTVAAAADTAPQAKRGPGRPPQIKQSEDGAAAGGSLSSLPGSKAKDGSSPGSKQDGLLVQPSPSKPVKCRSINSLATSGEGDSDAVTDRAAANSAESPPQLPPPRPGGPVQRQQQKKLPQALPSLPQLPQAPPALLGTTEQAEAGAAVKEETEAGDTAFEPEVKGEVKGEVDVETAGATSTAPDLDTLAESAAASALPGSSAGDGQQAAAAGGALPSGHLHPENAGSCVEAASCPWEEDGQQPAVFSAPSSQDLVPEAGDTVKYPDPPLLEEGSVPLEEDAEHSIDAWARWMETCRCRGREAVPPWVWGQHSIQDLHL